MSWRVVVISNRAKLDFKLGNMVVRGELDSNQVHLNEVSTLIIENTAVSLTAALLSELVERKIKVIFCDNKRNPSAELVPYYGSHDTSLKIRRQIEWSQHLKELIWTEIVTEKIEQQRDLLKEIDQPEHTLLTQYIYELEHNDMTNREGHAAKVYFNALFGKEFSRTQENNINAALNYGYSIILSAFNREIVANGYITQLGLFHNNMFNQFNLSSDLMEPIRPLVDRKVLAMKLEEFDVNEKYELVNILNQYVMIEGKRQYLNNAIKIYTKSVLDALSDNDVSLMRFVRNEL